MSGRSSVIRFDSRPRFTIHDCTSQTSYDDHTTRLHQVGRRGDALARLRARVPDSRRRRGRCPQAPADRRLSARRARRPEHAGAVRRSRLLPAATVDRHRAGRAATTAPSISTASSASTRGWRRSSRSGTTGLLAAIHACGSPDSTRSHFDAQDYMESATPGVKSTRDGWLNRYLQATNSTTPLQGVAVTRQTPRTMQGRAATLAVPGRRRVRGPRHDGIGASDRGQLLAHGRFAARRQRARGVRGHERAAEGDRRVVPAGERR